MILNILNRFLNKFKKYCEYFELKFSNKLFTDNTFIPISMANLVELNYAGTFLENIRSSQEIDKQKSPKRQAKVSRLNLFCFFWNKK